MPPKLFAGIDVGASATKCVIISEKKAVAGSAVAKTGIDLAGDARKVFDDALSRIDGGGVAVNRIVSTGFGRKNVPFADASKTEISCQSMGCYFHFPRAIVIVDIGGQDTKVIRTDADGKLKGFKMNRKCAAGTGTFLEEISHRLDISLEEMNTLATRSKRDVEIGAFCTVFTGTEILARIREGVSREDLAKGVYKSVVKRAMEMDTLVGDAVLTGGVVAHNPILIDMFAEMLGRKALIPPEPQFTGAFGAALYALRDAGQSRLERS
jgi:predicted CoA-substrate-specific enzyme activase